MSAKNVLSFRSDTTIFSMLPRRSAMTFFSRSCVIGRGVVTFSIWSAMALASNTPTQMGRTRWPSLSRRMMMGMLVIGSTINPLIVISICMVIALCPRRRRGGRFAAQAVRIRSGDRHRYDTPDPCRFAGKIHDRVAGGPARELPGAPTALRVHQDRLDPTERGLEQLPLDRPLERLQRHDPPRLLLLTDVVRHPLQRQRVRPRRVLEREHAVVARGGRQRQRLLEVRVGLTREADDHIGR